MSHRIPGQSRPAHTARHDVPCPAWCVAAHGQHVGEEDWVHTSEPLAVTDRILARICMTVDPASQVQDGPYVMLGSTELTPAEANAIGLSLQALASAAAEATPRARL